MNHRRMLIMGIALAVVLSAVAACGPEMKTSEPETSEPEEAQVVTTASGLQYLEVEEGDGPVPEQGDIVSIHFIGTLEDGTEFDNSYSRGETLSFPLGVGMVMPGWDEGIALMRVGSKAKLVVPPEIGLGEQGAGDLIPPNSTLSFEVELLDILPGSPEAPREVAEGDYVTTETGLQYYDFVVGDGAEATSGQTVAVHYTGWLLDGTKFDSSLDRGQPFAFQIGSGQVIPGWDEGVAGMKVGGQRQLLIPPELGYGEQGAGGVIPPNATLVFEVKLVEIQ